LHAVHHVTNHAQNVETRQNGLGQVNVLREGERGVVATAERIGRGEHGTSRLERGDDASLRDRDRLLLHGFVDTRTIGVVHLVELVDDADALVGQDKRSRLQGPLACDRTLLHVGGETDSAGALARGVHGTMSCLLHVLQELGLGCAWITAEQDVDVTTKLVLATRVLWLAAEEEQRNGTLDVLVTVNRWSNTRKDLEESQHLEILLIEILQFFLVNLLLWRSSRPWTTQ
jgi:hypothetical protein